MPPPTGRRTRSKEGRVETKISSGSESRRSSIASPSVVSAMIVDEAELEVARKRKRTEEDEARVGSPLNRMRSISGHLREYLFDSSHLISREVAKTVLAKVAEIEDVLLDIMLINERLVGMSHMSNREDEHTNDGTNTPATKSSYANAAAKMYTNKYENVKKKHAVVVRPSERDMTSEQVKGLVLKEVQPNMKDKVKVNAVRMIRGGGIAIEAENEKDLNKIKDSGLFAKVGLKVDMPRKIGPKIIVYDVPEEIANDELIKELYARNLIDMLEPNEMVDRVRIISRGGRKGSGHINAVIELPGRVWKSLVERGRIYIGWNSFKVRDFDVVPRCYGCYGFGHRIKECAVKGRVCRKCGVVGHIQAECKSETTCCRNCKQKGTDHLHDVMSNTCPEYVKMLQRMRAIIHYE